MPEEVWGICYVEDRDRPATEGGRTLAHPATFPSQAAADRWLKAEGFAGYMHAALTANNEDVKPFYPGQPMNKFLSMVLKGGAIAALVFLCMALWEVRQTVISLRTDVAATLNGLGSSVAEVTASVQKVQEQLTASDGTLQRVNLVLDKAGSISINSRILGVKMNDKTKPSKENK